MIRTFLFAALACLAACSRPPAPDPEQPPEPRAVAHRDLQRAIDAPLQKARAVQAGIDAAAEERREAIDQAEVDAGG